ncbi:MAG: histidine phosphatase family protein [Spirochaetia bacterium]|nr:histidine phosphatase family protein [Spirochaetia bacterium]
MNRKLVLIRHASTTAEKTSLVGKIDLPLSDEGKKDAQNYFGNILIQSSPVQLYVSTLLRAQQTAGIMFPGCKFKADARINEIDIGNWSNMNFSQISEKFPEAVDTWTKHPLEFRFPKGEGVDEFILRINNFLDSEILGFEGNSVMVCHGGVIRFIICRMLNIGYIHHLAFEVFRPSVNIIDHDGKTGVLTGLNIDKLVI